MSKIEINYPFEKKLYFFIIQLEQLLLHNTI